MLRLRHAGCTAMTSAWSMLDVGTSHGLQGPVAADGTVASTDADNALNRRPWP